MKEYVVRDDKMIGLARILYEQELIRCKDCDNRGKFACPLYKLTPPDDWFCAGGIHDDRVD